MSNEATPEKATTETAPPSCAPSSVVRPVRCHLCNRQMFYAGDPRHRPEVRVTVEGKDCCEVLYIHVACWNAKIRPNDRTEP